MAYIQLNNSLPGITGLLEDLVDTAAPICEHTQILLQGENSLTELKRELVATITSLIIYAIPSATISTMPKILSSHVVPMLKLFGDIKKTTTNNRVILH